ncbi:MAG: CTP synthase, partial [Rhodospirillaceae bacterium]|nr:CTP synthase [Rhodospirillaceae bacterium]
RDSVVPALDVESIYQVPISYHEQGLDDEVLRHFGIELPAPDLSRWKKITKRALAPEGDVAIAIVGKYMGLKDAYKSLSEALAHGGIANNVRVNLKWLEAEIFEEAGTVEHLEDVHGILVPGGFGERGAEGKIMAAKFARERHVPYFGICFGMQMAVVEAARNLAGIKGAGSTEFGPCDAPVVGLMTEWDKDGVTEQRGEDSDKGGTMRLGAYDCNLGDNSRVRGIYGNKAISERHRHRYEVNIAYEAELAGAGLVFSGKSPDGVLPEIVEIPEHPWFIGVQFHPELKSRPFEPHPLFTDFIRAAVDQSRLV